MAELDRPKKPLVWITRDEADRLKRQRRASEDAARLLKQALAIDEKAILAYAAKIVARDRGKDRPGDGDQAG